MDGETIRVHRDYNIGDHDDDGWGGWIGWIIAIIIFLIIIGLVIFFIFRNNNNVVTPTTLLPVYTFTSGSTSTTFLADNFTYFIATSPSSGMTINLTPPTTPEGKQFIIDNTRGSGTVTLTGPTITPTTTTSTVTTTGNKIPPRKAYLFVWRSSTEVSRIG